MATQWTYPCGGVPYTETVETNRTKWPVTGGAVAFLPSHPWAQTYINLGLGMNATRFNLTLVPTFNQTLNGTFCLPKVSLPMEAGTVKAGDKATIQVIQLSTSGGALYNCMDIEFADDAPAPAPEVCFNSTGVGAAPLQYGGASMTEDCPAHGSSPSPSPSGGAAPGGGSTGGAGALAVNSLMAIVVAAGSVAVFMV